MIAMEFIQIIELTTTRPEAFEALVDEWCRTTEGRRAAERGTFTKDRDRADTYVQIVEFPSYPEAMTNSELPETRRFGGALSELCDGEPVFRNLDVRSRAAL